jgi:hypothetical protein
MSRDANTPARLTSRARHVLNRPRIESTRRARSAAAPALGREATHLSRGAQDRLDRGAPRASHVASRLALQKEAAMARELSHDPKLARHRGCFV